ncbi:unnamed protein product [Gongylonema pulchrum]|uniref:Uncharacterized protein n=1 Tax=Gongylonema pulchrum TaxID=637853 RepID=A0A183DFR4_9BILA|nr:unnamed protein product [Gongylonema pulchrum]
MQSEDEYFGQQLYSKLNARIVCNYYYRDPKTHEPRFAYSKKLNKTVCSILTAGYDPEIDVTSSYKQPTMDASVSRDDVKTQGFQLLEEATYGEIHFSLSNFYQVIFC